MGKMTTYILLMSGIMLLLSFAGVIENNTSSYLLQLVFNPSTLPTFQFTNLIVAAIEGIAGISLMIGAVFTGNLELALMVPVVIWLLDMGFGFLQVFTKLYSVNTYVALLVFSPFFVLFLITIMEWWRGRD